MIIENKALLLQQIDKALDEIRPFLKQDFGDVEVVDITEDMIVKIKWLGNCQSCKMSDMTLKAGVESVLKNQIPGILKVEALETNL